MLTLRFESNSNIGQYQVYECERYNVNCERSQPNQAEIESQEMAPLRQVVRMFRSLADENPYYESVGDREPSGVCYVMNASGKTIDVIR